MVIGDGHGRNQKRGAPGIFKRISKEKLELR